MGARKLAKGRSVFVHVGRRPTLLNPGDEIPEGATVDDALLEPADADDDQGGGGGSDPEPFGQASDPKDYGVAEIAGYLDGLDEGSRDAEAQRILAAEVGGKNRQTLVARLS